jgi:hypothetical protein
VLSAYEVYDCQKFEKHWLKQLVASLSLQRPRFTPESIHMGFMVDIVVLGQVSLLSSLIFPCHCHSTGVPILICHPE